MSNRVPVQGVYLEFPISYESKADAEVALDTGDTKSMWSLVSIQQDHTAGAGANHQPAVGLTGFNTDKSKLRYQTTSAAKNTLVYETPSAKVVFFLEDGKLYFRPGFDAGADNTCEARVVLRREGGGEMPEVEAP